jgi:hypothetical protein
MSGANWPAYIYTIKFYQSVGWAVVLRTSTADNPRDTVTDMRSVLHTTALPPSQEVCFNLRYPSETSPPPRSHICWDPSKPSSSVDSALQYPLEEAPSSFQSAPKSLISELLPTQPHSSTCLLGCLLQLGTPRSTNTIDNQVAKGKCKNIINRSQCNMIPLEHSCPTTTSTWYPNISEEQNCGLKSQLMKIIEAFKENINNSLKETQENTTEQPSNRK